MPDDQKRKRIGYVDHAVDIGGGENSLIELISRLDQSRFIPVLLHTAGAKWLDRPELSDIEKVAAFQPMSLLEKKRDEVAARRWPLIWNALTTIQPAWLLHRALRRAKIDLVHTNSLKAHFIGGLAARLAHRPLVWHVRDLLGEDEGLSLLRRAIRMFTPRVIAISEAVAGQFAGLSAKVTVIPNGIPLDKFTPGPAPPQLRAELGLAEADKVIAVMGRLTPWKGHMNLLEAVSDITSSWPTVKLVVVGEVAFWEPEYEQQLKRRATELGLAEQVIWAGFRTDVPDILRLCDVFVLPSVNEPFGRAIIEAMAVGRPVVATASGGVPEIVVDGETGLLVPPEDPHALAQAIDAMLSDPHKSKEMGRQGLVRAREKFGADRVARQVQELYEAMLGA